MKRVFIKVKEFFCGKKSAPEKKSKVSKTEQPFEFPLSMNDDLETKSNKRPPRKDWKVLDNSKKAHRAFKRQSVQKEIRVISRNNLVDRMSEKERWMFRYLMKNGTRFISPTEVGRTYGKEVLNKDHYNSGHSRAVLMEFVKLKLATKNQENHYKYLPIN
jgi:hypothetical protein